MRQETSQHLATAWELPGLIRPLPAAKRLPRKYRPQELRHYAAVVEYVYQSRLAVRSQIQRRFPAWIGWY